MKKLLLLTSLATVAAVPVSQAALASITPAGGHTFTHDGNDGDFYDNVSVPAPSPAHAGMAGTAFAADDPGGHPVPHVVSNLNDGFYGNSSSHINGLSGTNMGILLPQPYFITSIAFGRDNGNPNDCCGGQLRGRDNDTYTLEYTNDGGGSWIAIGNLVYDNAPGDDAPGGLFDDYLRHEYEVGAPGGGPITADGVRISFLDHGTAIDEIEIYGNPVPEPSGLALLGLGAFGFLLRRRR